MGAKTTVEVVFRESDLNPVHSPPDYQLLNQIASRFADNCNPQNKVMDRGPESILLPMSRVQKYIATLRGAEKKALWRLINYLIQYGGIIMTNDRRFIYDAEQFAKIIDASKKKIRPEISHDLQERLEYFIPPEPDEPEEVPQVEIVELKVRAETSKVRVGRVVKARGGEYFKRLRKRSNFTDRDDFIFCQIDSPNKFRRESFYSAWQELMKGANIKDHKERKLTWYSLRHYGITTRLRAEIDVTTLADIAGTSIEQIEKHYGHIDSSMRDRAILKDPIYMPVGTEESTWD